VVLFGLAAALGVGLAFGSIPAWQATSASLTDVMGSQSRSVTAGGSRLRRLIVSGEVAAAVLLLCGAGLLLQTMLTLLSADPGYRSASDSVLTLDFSLPTNKESRYPTQASLDQFYRTVTREVEALPEVRRVGWASSLPYGTSELGRWIAEVEGAAAEASRDRPTADLTAADPGYFATLDLPILKGRGFTDADTEKAPLICLVNEAFASRHFQGRDPIGARLVLRAAADQAAHTRQIAGVVRQTSGEPDAPEALRQVYVPLAQFGTGDVYMVVQPEAGSAAALAPLVRRVVGRLDPDLSVRRDRTLEVLSIQSTASYRFRTAMVTTFAALALLLAMVGVFGVLAHAVEQRRREIGVRMALGATSRRVIWTVFRDAGAMVATGAVVGVVLAALSTRLISTFLFGVDPLDPLTFLTAPIVILSTALVAAAAPAWRASRIDPVVAFRQEH
jgi:putative ABC transport system permease protein